ncbi:MULTISPECIES: DUF397 domain-containing protein [unclassified Streptomyces]|uniref:DUF397 domain-containing protein n=1 Tax=unclassified Streptomyces TaxID=2593676 RepID=UPI00093901E5|nr:DUF397 domain-containing protein [Streptomyces sp. CB02400]OKK10671.1 hypothetical protein AMK33_10960 [Streptomyces sp. CB02400]
MKPSSKPDLSSVSWRKSSYSNSDGADCLEVADDLPGLTPVRDSKNPQGPALLFTADAWNRFVASLGN